MWGREWAIATYKHPALPSWVLEASRLATGTVGWPAYLAGQLFVAATYLCAQGLPPIDGRRPRRRRHTATDQRRLLCLANDRVQSQRGMHAFVGRIVLVGMARRSG